MWPDAVFQFYLTHNNNYKEEYIVIFEQLMKDRGYEISTLWKGRSSFLYLKK